MPHEAFNQSRLIFFQGHVDVKELIDGLSRLGIPLAEAQLEGLHKDCDVNEDKVFPEAIV